jgi:hypothetical protein
MNNFPRLNRLLGEGGRRFDITINHGFFYGRSLARRNGE